MTRMKWTAAVAGFLMLSPWPGPSATALTPTFKHWRRESGLVAVTVFDQTRDESWGKALRKLINEWNARIVGVQLNYTPDSANDNCDIGRGAFTVVVCVKENTKNNHLAETHYWYDGDHLLQAMIWMDPRPAPPRNHLACHELGHALGLNHRPSNEKKTCMTNVYKRNQEHPDQVDFDGVNSTYSHMH